MVNFEVPQLKPDENHAAIVACVRTIIRTGWQNARIISIFDLLNSKSDLRKAVFIRPNIIGLLTNFVSVLTNIVFIMAKSNFITTKTVRSVTDIDFIRANLEFVATFLKVAAIKVVLTPMKIFFVTAKTKGGTMIFTFTAPNTGSFWRLSGYFPYFGLFSSNRPTSDERMGESSRTGALKAPAKWVGRLAKKKHLQKLSRKTQRLSRFHSFAIGTNN
jgi:hypothetical protein